MKKAIVAPSWIDERKKGPFLRDLEDWMARVSDLGYDGVELDVCDPKELDADGIERLATRFGLEIPAVGTGRAWQEEGLSFTAPCSETRQAALTRFEAHLPVAAELGALVVMGLLRGTVPPEGDSEEAMIWLTEALRRCAEVAGQHGVRIAFELINRYESTLVNNAAEGMALLSRVGAQNVGLLLDTFHMNIEEPDIYTSIQRCAPALFHFHVADSNRQFPGSGHLDFATILGALREAGYRGYMSVEADPIPCAEVCAARSIAALRAWDT